MHAHNYCLSEQCPADKQMAQGSRVWGTAWANEHKGLSAYFRTMAKRVDRMDEDERLRFLEYYHRDWYQTVLRHDSFEDQGARRIIRLKREIQQLYGNNWWVRIAFRATRYILPAGASPAGN